jgi:hypothetical protein
MAGGLLLGSSVALKPFALPALVALLAPRLAGKRRAGARLPGKHPAGKHPAGKHAAGEWIADRWPGPEQRAGLLGIVLAGATLLGPPYAHELLTQPIETLSTIRTVSFDRLLRLLGLPLPRFVVLGVVYAMLAGAATLWTRSRLERQLVAFAGAMVAAPLVWSHTMILGLPMLTLALACHAPDLASRAPADRRPRLVALAVFALVALQLFFQPGGFDHHAVPVQILFATPMLAAPPLTATLVIRRLRADAVLPGG